MFDREGGARHQFASRKFAVVWMLAMVLLVASPARPQSADNSDDDASATRAAHKVKYSFVFMGCNRVLKGDKSPENPSTANLAQLERSFAEIAALKPRPKFVVFTGDLVLGLTPDLNKLRNHLASWIDVYLNSDLC